MELALVELTMELALVEATMDKVDLIVRVAGVTIDVAVVAAITDITISYCYSIIMILNWSISECLKAPETCPWESYEKSVQTNELWIPLGGIDFHGNQ